MSNLYLRSIKQEGLKITRFTEGYLLQIAISSPPLTNQCIYGVLQIYCGVLKRYVC